MISCVCAWFMDEGTKFSVPARALCKELTHRHLGGLVVGTMVSKLNWSLESEVTFLSGNTKG